MTSTTTAGPLLAISLDGAGDPAAAAQAAEAAGFDLAVFGDPIVREDVVLDGVQAAAFAAPRTRRIALVAESEVLFPEPFHLATQLASLDFAAKGRAGWLVAGHATDERAAAYGRAPLDAAAIRREADDVVEVARRLWDSWEDDAVIRDGATGRYLDGSRLHHVDFEGATFSVRGPLITPRPPQGQLPVLAPWGLTDPRAADVVVIASSGSVDSDAATAREARDAGATRVLVDVTVAGDSASTGRRAAELGAFADVVLLRAAAGTDPAALHPTALDRAALGLGPVPTDPTSLRAALGLTRPASRYALTEVSR